MTTWTTPQTWTAAQVVTAADLNTDIRDNMGFLYSPNSVGAYRSTDQSIGASSWVSVNLTDESWITAAGMHGTGGTNSQIGPGGSGGTGKAGRYLFIGHVEFTADSGGTLRHLNMRRNSAGSHGSGTSMSSDSGLATAVIGTKLNVSKIIDCAAGDYCELFVYQDKASAVSLIGGSDTIYFQAHWIGN